MKALKDETFVCIDCETTGLDTENDAIIELAAVRFTFSELLESFETLVNPQRLIPAESIAIHHITDEMVQGQPTIDQVLRDLFTLTGDHCIIGHGIAFDINIIANEAKKHNIPTSIQKNPSIDTLRLARLYGQSRINSLDALRQHFNVETQGAHRAMSDVQVNIEVFKHLTTKFKSKKEIMKRLEKPILLPTMPLGKHKGRPFSEIPLPYLKWAANMDFDQDLLFSLRTELKKRKSGSTFSQSSNPFAGL